MRWRALEEAGARIIAVRGETVTSALARCSIDLVARKGTVESCWKQVQRLLRNYLEGGFVDQLKLITAPIRGGSGLSLADWLHEARLKQTEMSECGADSVMEAFLAVDF